MGITFKREIFDNRWIGQPSVDIKLNKKVIGSISAPRNFLQRNYWQIGYAVVRKELMEDGNPNCKWRWITLELKHDNLNLAKEFVRKEENNILKQFNIRKD